MVLVTVLLVMGLCPPAGATAAEPLAVQAPAQKSRSKPLALNAFVETALAEGQRNHMAGPIARLVDVAPDTPIHLLRVEPEQTTDKMAHVFRVLVDFNRETKQVTPIGLLLDTHQVWSGRDEDYWMRASLGGALEKVAAIRGKRDEQNRVIKGSGEISEPDIAAPEVKKRFKHELDFWLKKAYLKKEWRSAEFSDGVLKKKTAP